MSNEFNQMLRCYAELVVADQKFWKTVYGVGGDKSQAKQYSVFRAQNTVARQAVLATLKTASYPVQEYTITGQAPNTVNHYDIDNLIKAEFGDQVITDSEHSQLFIYTTEAAKDAVFARIRELAGEGMVTLYSGDTYPSSFSMERDDELQIAAMGSWESAHRWLAENS